MQPWRPFAQQLAEELDAIEVAYLELIRQSAIRNTDPNRGQSAVVVLGAAKWGWVQDDSLVADRTRLLERFNEWLQLFELLHRAALPTTRKRIDKATGAIDRWLSRPGRDKTVPPTPERAVEITQKRFCDLRELLALGVHGETETIAVPDTNSLLRQPDIAEQARAVTTGPCTVVLLPAVMAELDEQKDRGRTEDVRDRASKVVRRVKGLRDRGDLRSGVPVEGAIRFRAEHKEARVAEVLGWLDPSVPDDRILAAAVDLQARRPRASVVLVTGDINLQTKAAAVGLPFTEPPA